MIFVLGGPIISVKVITLTSRKFDLNISKQIHRPISLDMKWCFTRYVLRLTGVCYYIIGKY